ncbi:MAG: hypothetical protein ACI8RZ_000315 [Myxococcota bacterium]|jgi:hypothetical protein
MQKTFPLTSTSHKPPQVLAGIKNTVRKYLKRERRKSLPEDVDFWDFDCRIGSDEASASTVVVGEIVPGIDAIAQAGASAVYIEILVKPGIRVHRQKPEQTPEA